MNITESLKMYSEAALIELANFHLENGQGQLFMINGTANIRVELPTGEFFVITI